MMRPVPQQSGFTLVELLVYISIFMLVSVGSIAFYFSVQDVFTQYQVRQALFVSSTNAMERLLMEIREADTVSMSESVLATSTGALALGSTDTGTTTIAISDSDLIVTAADGTQSVMGTDAVTVSDFVVQHYESDVSELVRVTIGLTAERGGYSEQFELTGAAVVRGSYAYGDE